MESVRALIFDVGGTVFNWQGTVSDHMRRLTADHRAAIDTRALANDWGRELFKVHAQVRQGNLPWMNTDEMHLRALEVLATDYPLLASVGDPAALVTATWHRLEAHAGAAEAINRLRRDYTVVVLTNLSWQSIVSSSKLAGIQWDGILSCEFLGYYKPSLQAYLRGTSLLGLEPDEAMLVSADAADLAAAQAAGLATAYLHAPIDDIVLEGFGEAEATFSLEASDFDDLCQQLGRG